jgi:hypothetical protein
MWYSLTRSVMPTHDGDDHQERRQHDHQQTQTIDADVVRDAELRNPRHVFDKLQISRRAETREENRANHEFDQHGQQRNPADGAVIPTRDKEKDQRADERENNEKG